MIKTRAIKLQVIEGSNARYQRLPLKIAFDLSIGACVIATCSLGLRAPLVARNKGFTKANGVEATSTQNQIPSY